MSKEAMKLALEALEIRCGTNAEERGPSGAIIALREALAEKPAQQEPVLQPAGLSDAVYTVLEGFTLPHDVRKILETAFYGPASIPPPAQQEPAATITITQRGPIRIIDNDFDECVRDWPDGEYKLYASPPAQRTWVGLTDEEKLHIEIMGGKSDVMLAEMVEAKLKEKNT